MNPIVSTLLLAACGLHLAGIAHAERADRDRPVKLEADRVNVDDAKRIHVFEGNVALSQGTMSIRTAKLVVTEDAEGFQKIVARGGEGGLVRFRQKREAREDYVEGEAERIEYDARTERAEFTARARFKSGGDVMEGAFISYDGLTEKFSIASAPAAGGGQTGNTGKRVTVTLQPKNAGAPAIPIPGTSTPSR